MKTNITLYSFIFAAFFLIPALASARTEVSGTLASDTTWTASNSPYVISVFGLTVPAGVTLTIEQGVVVKASQNNTPLTINGTLDVEGTNFFPTYFTSFNDTAVGGDTGFSPFGFSWMGVIANSGAIIRLNHAVIRNASVGISNNGGTVTVSNSIFENDTNGISHGSGTTTVAASTFQNNQTGISSWGSGSLSFVGNTFSNNSALADFDLSGGLVFTNANNTANGMGRQGIFLYANGENIANQTLSADFIAYVVKVFGVNIPAGKTFTVQPGAIIKFEQYNASLTVNGTLDVQGTAPNPAYFTSLDDDTIGGDSDGGSNSAFISQWGNITLAHGAVARFTHSIFRRGGSISNNGGTLNVSNSEIADSSSYGIIHGAGTTAVAGTAFSNNSYGLYAGGTGTISLTNNTFANERAGSGYFELSSGLTFANVGNSATGTRGGFFLFANGADTMSNQTFSGDAIPYVITTFGVTIPVGKTFTVEPGAIVKFEQNNAPLTINGMLDMRGTVARPIYVTAFSDDTLGGDTDGTDNPPYYYQNWGNIAVNSGAVAHIDRTIFNNGGIIMNNGGALTISHSEISGSSSYGIIHGAGTTTVSKSSIHDNASYGMYNSAADSLNAENNWWGSPTGPRHASNPDGTGDRVSDNVDFTPWLGYDPTLETPLALGTPTETEDDNNQDTKGTADKTNFTFSVTADGTPDTVTLIAVSETATTTLPLSLAQGSPVYVATSTFPKGHYTWHIEATKGTETVRTPDRNFTTGYSNVAFLPGLEASRLYRPATDPDDSSVTKVRLWEPPLALQDNSQLFLNPDGTPKRSDIFTEDPIDEAYGFNIYKNFIGSMNDLVLAGTIHTWKPFPYDWRFDIHDIVDHPIALESGSYSMTEEIRKLAESSDTGKVIIIAHSNGGLVGKTLISEMEARGQADVFEKFIMVAVPQLGTPKAIASLLHGEGMPSDILPVLLSKTDSRILAENMPSGYSLLPSAEYLARVIDPVASFDSTDPLTAQYFARYGNVITNQTELHDFLLGAEGRTKPETSDTFTPNILNGILLAQAESNHAILDHWIAPAGMEVIQIAGWGLDTIKGLKYREIDPCTPGCSMLDHEPEFTSDGDETVVIPSAVAGATARTYYVNLPKNNFLLEGSARRNRDHSDIMEVKELQDFLISIIHGFMVFDGIVITDSKPPVTDVTKRLRLKVHSPVSLHLYNSFGEHTGLATTTGDIHIIEKQIPNSYYLEVGEGKYAGVEENGTTTVTLFGEAFGTFTLDIEEVAGDSVTASTTFAGIPVTASSTATMIIGTLASGTPKLAVDIDGDGETDAIISAGDGVTVGELTDLLKGFIQTLNLPDKKEAKLLKRIEKLEKELKKEHKNQKKEKRKTRKAFEELTKQIKKFEKKNILTAEEARELINIIERIKNSVVK